MNTKVKQTKTTETPKSPGVTVKTKKYQQLLARADELRKHILTTEGYNDLLTYLHLISRFYRFSAFNILLIQLQNPSASRINGYMGWQQLGRQVKRREKPIKILVPRYDTGETGGTGDSGDVEEQVSFRMIPVYDILQTIGGCVPKINIKEENLYFYLEKLIEMVKENGVRLSQVEDLSAYGITNGQKILLRQKESDKTKFLSLCHEYLHILLKHKDCNYLSDGIKELECETGAMVIGSFFKVKMNGTSFLKQWTQGKKSFKRLNLIRQAVKFIIDELLDRIKATK